MTTSRATDAPYDPLDATDPDPIGHLAEARERCPVSEPRPGVFVLTRHADVKIALHNPKMFSSEDSFVLEGGTPTSALPATPITMMDPPDHTALRARLRRWFSPAKLRNEEPRIREIISETLASMVPGQQVEVWSAFGRTIPARTVYAFLGLPQHDWEQVHEWADAINDHFPQFSIELPQMVALAGYLGQLIASRAADAATGRGVIDGLVHPQPGEDPLEPVEIVMHCVQLILAGIDSTGILITNLLYQLLADRERWQRVVDDRALIPRVIEESLRHDAPIQYALRTVRADGEISRCPVQVGDRIVLSLQSANLDETVWGIDAAMFSVDRDPRQAAQLSFGHGIHTCLGAPLARLEAQLLLEALTERFPRMRLAPGYVWHAVPQTVIRRPTRLDIVL